MFTLKPFKFEEDCHDRLTWRAMRFEGLSPFEASIANNRELRRQKKHAAPRVDQLTDNMVNDPLFQCLEGGRVCRSRIGLFSHRRTDRVTAAARSGSHVIIDNDRLH